MDINVGNIIEFQSKSQGITGGLAENAPAHRVIAQVNVVDLAKNWITVYTPDRTRIVLVLPREDIKVLSEKAFAGWGAL